MNKKIPWIVTAVFVLWLLAGLRSPSEDGPYAINEFGKIPVVLNGRVQPLDSVARNALLAIQGKQTVELESGEELRAIEWMMEVMLRPGEADSRQVFRIHHPEVLRLLEIPDTKKQGMNYVSFTELRPKFQVLEKEANRIREIEAQLRDTYEREVAKLHFSLILYHRIKASLQPEDTDGFFEELKAYEQAIDPGVKAVRAREAGQPYDEEAFETLLSYMSRYDQMARFAYPLVVPPPPHDHDHAEGEDHNHDHGSWINVGQGLLNSARMGVVPEEIKQWAAITEAYSKKEPSRFNTAVADYKAMLSSQYPDELKKGSREFFFNAYEPFYKTKIIYVVAFILACFSWLNMSKNLSYSAYYLVFLGFLIHTFGLLFRMILEGRPPVTNLYSSAVFVGWGAVVLGLILEKIYHDGIGSVTASSVGFITLLVSHYLSLDGDTMEMLRAVLDTNAWLATHVVIINLGYSATYIAGFLAIIYVMRGVFTKSLTKATASSLNRMVYGVICFAILFSFVGTVLGGIWADQSWGRFWGWDPKENGALLIVLWCAVILHARWGGLIRERGLMLTAIFGNVITSWSYFGVNTLGIGLHSYGFMDGSFRWLLIFIITQMIFILIGALPRKYWRSFSGDDGRKSDSNKAHSSTLPRPGTASAGA